MPDETNQKPIVAGHAPDGVDAASRAAYEAGMRDRTKIMNLDVDPTRVAATGATEGNGGGGNIEELPAEMRRAGIDPGKATR
jgi:hypothetical protein